MLYVDVYLMVKSMKNQTGRSRDFQIFRDTSCTKVEPGSRELNSGPTPCHLDLVFSNPIKTSFAKEYMLKGTLISVKRAIYSQKLRIVLVQNITICF